MILSTEQVYDYVRGKVVANTPFALLRFGDGEGLFAFTPTGAHRIYAAASKKHWGEIPKGIRRLEIMKNIRNSYRKCDVAGLPYGFKGRMWLLALENFTKMMDHPVTCRADVHLAMAEDRFIEGLVPDRDVFYIACRNLDSELKAMGARSVDRILISPQYKFEEKKPLVPFYKQVGDIERELKKKNLKRRICLLAVGVAGKQFGIQMRTQGGMVIDVGSMFDYWKGKKTRGWMNWDQFTNRQVVL
jgi:hypothetical protein